MQRNTWAQRNPLQFVLLLAWPEAWSHSEADIGQSVRLPAPGTAHTYWSVSIWTVVSRSVGHTAVVCHVPELAKTSNFFFTFHSCSYSYRLLLSPCSATFPTTSSLFYSLLESWGLSAYYRSCLWPVLNLLTLLSVWQFKSSAKWSFRYFLVMISVATQAGSYCAKVSGCDNWTKKNMSRGLMIQSTYLLYL